MKTSCEKDFTAWLEEQIKYLRKKEFDKLDVDLLVEELEDLGRYNKTAISSHLIVIMIHMLKQMQQPEMKTKSWDDSIVNGRVQIREIIEDNPSLRRYPGECLSNCYRAAIRHASRETGLDSRKFPAGCPWSLKELLGD
jgi:hypothetical protein